jgi:hypothetical protein
MRGLSKSILVAIALLLFSANGLNAQVPDWCLRWTDNCSTCSRTDINADPTCTQPGRGCVTRAISCLAADPQEAKRHCERVVVDLNYCNACSRKPDGTFMCTLKGCEPRILCMRPRQT